MEKLSQLKSMIRAEKTLIIACHKHYPGIADEWRENVFLIESSGNALQHYDFQQQEYLRHYIEGKNCRQILVVGHHHRDAVAQISEDHSPESPLSVLAFNLKLLLGKQGKNPIAQHVREQILVETNIIQQCQLLLENDFIQERVANHSLHLIAS